MSGKNIKDTMEKLAPSKLQVERMYGGIVERESGPGRRRTDRRLRTILIAAAVCACTAASVFAVSRGLDSGFFTFLKPSQEQAEYLADGAYIVDKTVAEKNGTLEVRQLLGDEYNMYILMDFTAPEGVVLDAARYQFEPIATEFSIERDNSAHGWGFSVVDDGSPADNKISLIMTISSEGSVAGKDFSMTLRDLQAAGPYPSEFKTVIEGSWKVSFPLNYKNTSSTYEIGRPVTLYGETLTLEHISVSPVSVNLYMVGEGSVKKVVSKSREESDQFDGIPVTLVFSDGVTLTTTDENSDLWQLGRGDQELISTKSFHQVIDHKKVTSVIIFGQEFELKNQ